MSFDDPGWGTWLPQPGDDPGAPPTPQPPAPQAPAAPPAQPPAAPPPQAPPPPAPSMGQGPPPGPPSWSTAPVPAPTAPLWRRPVVLIVAAVVLVAAVAGIVLATSNNSSSGSRNAVSPPPSPAQTSAPASGQDLNGQFIAAADAICAKYLPGINQADAAGDTAQVVNLFEGELTELNSLGEPPRDQATYDNAISYAEDVVTDLQTGDVTSANTAAVQADTYAGKFGLKVCNNGH
jgi:hypothetical protein